MENKIIGYRVVSQLTGGFLHVDDATGRHYFHCEEPLPISRGDAFRRLASFLDQSPDMEMSDYDVEPVYYEPTVIESTSEDLARMLYGFVGDKLGISQEQMRLQLASELTQFTELAKRFGVSQ